MRILRADYIPGGGLKVKDCDKYCIGYVNGHLKLCEFFKANKYCENHQEIISCSKLNSLEFITGDQ